MTNWLKWCRAWLEIYASLCHGDFVERKDLKTIVGSEQFVVEMKLILLFSLISILLHTLFGGMTSSMDFIVTCIFHDPWCIYSVWDWCGMCMVHLPYGACFFRIEFTYFSKRWNTVMEQRTLFGGITSLSDH